MVTLASSNPLLVTEDNMSYFPSFVSGHSTLSAYASRHGENSRKPNLQHPSSLTLTEAKHIAASMGYSITRNRPRSYRVSLTDGNGWDARFTGNLHDALDIVCNGALYLASQIPADSSTGEVD